MTAGLMRLVVGSGETLWGRYDIQAPIAHARGSPAGEDEDLLNQAAVSALRNGGRSFAVPRERLPRRVPAVAELRY